MPPSPKNTVSVARPAARTLGRPRALARAACNDICRAPLTNADPIAPQIDFIATLLTHLSGPAQILHQPQSPNASRFTLRHDACVPNDSRKRIRLSPQPGWY